MKDSVSGHALYPVTVDATICGSTTGKEPMIEVPIADWLKEGDGEWIPE